MAKRSALAVVDKEAAPLQAYVQPGAVAAIQAWEKAVGGREKLVDAILGGPPSTQLDYVIGLIADPRNDAVDLAAICARGKVSLGELLEAFKRGVIAKAQADAIRRVAERLPLILDDLITRAAPYDEECVTCGGLGTVTSPKTPDAPPTACDVCRGKGKFRRLPELERQKVVLELARLNPKGPSVQVGVNVQQPTAPADVLDKVLHLADKVLYGRPAGSDVVDAELTEADTNGHEGQPTAENTPAPSNFFPTCVTTSPDGSPLAPDGTLAADVHPAPE